MIIVVYLMMDFFWIADEIFDDVNDFIKEQINTFDHEMKRKIKLFVLSYIIYQVLHCYISFFVISKVLS